MITKAGERFVKEAAKKYNDYNVIGRPALEVLEAIRNGDYKPKSPGEYGNLLRKNVFEEAAKRDIHMKHIDDGDADEYLANHGGFLSRMDVSSGKPVHTILYADPGSRIANRLRIYKGLSRDLQNYNAGLAFDHELDEVNDAIDLYNNNGRINETRFVDGKTGVYGSHRGTLAITNEVSKWRDMPWAMDEKCNRLLRERRFGPDGKALSKAVGVGDIYKKPEITAQDIRNMREKPYEQNNVVKENILHVLDKGKLKEVVVDANHPDIAKATLRRTIKIGAKYGR